MSGAGGREKTWLWLWLLKGGGAVTALQKCKQPTRMPKSSVPDIQKVPIFTGKHAPRPLLYHAPKDNSTALQCKKA